MTEAMNPNPSAPAAPAGSNGSDTPSPTPAHTDATLAKLMAPDSPYWAPRGTPGHDEAVRAVTARMAEMESGSAPRLTRSMSTSEALSQDQNDPRFRGKNGARLRDIVNSEAYLDPKHPDHKRVVEEARGLMVDSRDNPDNLEADRAHLRQKFDVNTLHLPKGVTVTEPEDEATFLHFAVDQGLDRSQVRMLYQTAAAWEVSDKVVTPEKIASVVKDFEAQGIPPSVSKALIDWYLGTDTAARAPRSHGAHEDVRRFAEGLAEVRHEMTSEHGVDGETFDAAARWFFERGR